MVCMVLMATGTLSAHHDSWAAVDVNARFRGTGTLTKVDWRNPHIQLSVDVKSDQGVETWLVEGPPPTFWRTRGTNKRDLEHAIGKTVTVDVFRAKDGSRTGLMRAITLPDGKFLSYKI